MFIPGYEKAIGLERKRREAPYIVATDSICGIPIQQVTPRLLAILTNSGTPYLGIGEITAKSTLHILWVLSVERSEATWFLNFRKDRFIKRNQAIDFDKAETELWEFLDATFMDAPTGRASVPYASTSAWLEYSMSAKPFCWDYDTKTADTPIRRIYQLLRCRSIDNGAALANQVSDTLRGEWLKEIQAKTKGMNSDQLADFYTRLNKPEGLN